MQALRIPLRAVLYRQSGRWVAHCLEFDLLGDGASPHAAIESLSKAIEIQIKYSAEHGNPGNLFTPAEGKYFQMFAAGKNIAEGQLHLRPLAHPDSIAIESLDAREYDDGTVEDDALCV